MQFENFSDIELKPQSGASSTDNDLVRQVRASVRDRPEGDFPRAAFDLLTEYGYMTAVLPEDYGGDPRGSDGGSISMLDRLMKVGTMDLSLGRLYEGHINALHLIGLYGAKEQRDTYFAEASAGHIFGVWNTDLPPDPVRMNRGAHGCALRGKKIFCSGGLGIQRPIITAYTAGVPQMILVHTENMDREREDIDSWNPLGMKSSRSFCMDFSGYSVPDGGFLGRRGHYLQEPHFSTGAARFAAVQLGGAEAMAEAAFTHLITLNRHTDAVQQQRMGEIAILLESGRNWIREMGRVLDRASPDPEGKINYANMTRTAIAAICKKIMHHAEKAVGLSGMMSGHAMERLHRDLTTYLMQPGPDRALAKVGEWAAKAEQWDRE